MPIWEIYGQVFFSRWWTKSYNYPWDVPWHHFLIYQFLLKVINFFECNYGGDRQKRKVPAPTKVGGSSGFWHLNSAYSGRNSGMLGHLGISHSASIYATKSGKHNKSGLLLENQLLDIYPHTPGWRSPLLSQWIENPRQTFLPLPFAIKISCVLRA